MSPPHHSKLMTHIAQDLNLEILVKSSLILKFLKTNTCSGSILNASQLSQPDLYRSDYSSLYCHQLLPENISGAATPVSTSLLRRPSTSDLQYSYYTSHIFYYCVSLYLSLQSVSLLVLVSSNKSCNTIIVSLLR